MCEMVKHFRQFFLNSTLRKERLSPVSSFLCDLVIAYNIVDLLVNGMHNFVIKYADDILLLSLSLFELHRMFTDCGKELTLSDMTINAKNRIAYALDLGLKPTALTSILQLYHGTALS
jgi:hypothetical protein